MNVTINVAVSGQCQRCGVTNHATIAATGPAGGHAQVQATASCGNANCNNTSVALSGSGNYPG